MSIEEWLDLPDLIDKAQELLELGFFEEAQKLLDQYKDVYSNDWEIHFLYSRLFAEQNMPRAAIRFLLNGLRIERDNVDCLLGLFYAHAMMDQVKKGGKFLLKAQKHHPYNELVWSALIWYYTEINNPQKAIFCFEEAVKINQDNPETFRNAGIAYSQLGRFEDMQKCYQKTLDINPAFEEARDLLADHFIFINKADEAVKLYDEALKNSPKNIHLMSKLVFCFSQNNQLDKATAAAKKTISLYPNSLIGYIDLAYVHLNTERIEDAIIMAQKAINVAPIDTEGYRVMGIALSEKNDFEGAEKYFEKAITLDPENIEALRDYYHHLRNADKYEEMIAIVNKVIELEHPYCTEDYCFLADYYRGESQNLKAFHYLNRAYKSMPSEKELLPPMIGIMFERGHIKYGMSAFAEFVEKSGGWNDSIMRPFMQNKVLRDRFTQEGLRFLRFTGERHVEFRKYIFRHYLSRFAFIYYTVILCALMFPASVLFGLRGAAAVTLIYGASLGIIKLYKIRRHKKIIDAAEEALQAIG
ncbi:MAG: tetratricopeptide repeat protein [Chitinispirillia bacterium]|nr:tetratricopeptide repeat protein [Chitinispirillia bacterium]